MKKYVAILVLAVLGMLHVAFADSGPQWECKTTGSTPVQLTQMVNVLQPLIIIMVDFPDGRLANGSLPTQDSDTALVANIDAVGSMGFTSPFLPPQDGPSKAKIRKYVYEDYWDMIYSTNECVELIRARNIPCVVGNHDKAVIVELPIGQFSKDAQAGIIWTAERLSTESRKYLKSLPFIIQQVHILFVHGSPDTPGKFRYLIYASDTRENFRCRIAAKTCG